MRIYPGDGKEDNEELARLNVEPWMVELLLLNPGYTWWGPHEDYMWTKDKGWSSAVFCDSWKEFRGDGDENSWTLGDLNECVNFYFHLDRKTAKCKACDQCGYNPETKKIADSFYGALYDKSDKWNDKITQDEVDALIREGRLVSYTHETKPGEGWVPKDPVPRVTAEQINADTKSSQGLGPHDGINRGILIETRAKRLGVWGMCPECEGHGYVFTEPKGCLCLTLWWLHPRKGCSRGIEIRNIQQADLQDIYDYLAEAADRNAERFLEVCKLRSDMNEENDGTQS